MTAPEYTAQAAGCSSPLLPATSTSTPTPTSASAPGDRPDYAPASTAEYLKKEYWDQRFEQVWGAPHTEQHTPPPTG